MEERKKEKSIDVNLTSSKRTTTLYIKRNKKKKTCTKQIQNIKKLI